MGQIDYSLFHEMLELKRKSNEFAGQAMLLDCDKLGKGNELWAEAKELDRAWKNRREQVYENKENIENWAAIYSTHQLIDSFCYLDEKKLIKALNALDIGVVGYVEN